MLSIVKLGEPLVHIIEDKIGEIVDTIAAAAVGRCVERRTRWIEQLNCERRRLPCERRIAMPRYDKKKLVVERLQTASIVDRNPSLQCKLACANDLSASTPVRVVTVKRLKKLVMNGDYIFSLSFQRL